MVWESHFFLFQKFGFSEVQLFRFFFWVLGSSVGCFLDQLGFRSDPDAYRGFAQSSYEPILTEPISDQISCLFGQKISDPEQSKLFLKCKSPHLAILINI